jgi:large-conductance mechanosensitive channel
MTLIKTLLNYLIICLIIAIIVYLLYRIRNDGNPRKNKLIRIYPISNKQLDQLNKIENRFEVRFI